MPGSSPPQWFNDYAVGYTVTSPSRVIADDDIRAYVRFSNDVRPLVNADPPYPVPQMYLFSLSVGMLLHAPGGGYIPKYFVAFFGFDTIDFHRGATAGDSIRSTATVTAVTPRGRNGLVTYHHEATRADGVALVSSVQRILVQRAPDVD